MMDRRYKTLTVVIVLAALLCSRAIGAQELIVNRTFDAGIDGWIALGYGTGSLEWAAGQGNPSGSLRLTIDDVAAISQDCFPILPGGTVTFSADAFAQTPDRAVACRIIFAFFKTDDCTGPVFEIVDHFQSTRLLNEWEVLTFTAPELVDFPSFKPALVKIGGNDPTDTCLFDNVSVIRNAPPTPPFTEVPTTSTAGLLVLGSLLGAMALVLLRRKRGET